MLFISKAYRTTSTDALNVPTSIPPIDLTVVRESKYHRLVRLGKEEQIRGINYLPDQIEWKIEIHSLEPWSGLQIIS